MKKTLILLILAIGSLSFTKNEVIDSDQKLTETELRFLKENYNWHSEDFMIINFRQPKSKCEYDNYKDLKKSSKWWADFYSEMNLTNVRNIFVFSDSLKAKKVIDSKNDFADLNSIILDRFFSKDKSCYGILVINRKGDFQKKVGEYTQEHIAEMLSKLD